MTHKYPFEKLEVWTLAKDLAKQTYLLTKKFPEHEKFGLISQMNRAVVSVASTIAEGTARASRKDQAQFSQIAYASLMELACQFVIAEELGYVSEEQHSQIRKNIEHISNKINALRRYQLSLDKGVQLNSSTPQRLNMSH